MIPASLLKARIKYKYLISGLVNVYLINSMLPTSDHCISSINNTNGCLTVAKQLMNV